MKNTEKRSDQALLDAFLSAEDGSAMDALIERYRNKVINYLRMKVKDRQTADDLFQETFIKAIDSLQAGRYVDNGKFVSWVLRIAHNQVVDYFRGKRGPMLITNDDAGYDVLNNASLTTDPNVEDEMMLDQVEQDMRELIEQLPKEQRQVVLLRHYMDLSFREIAEQTGVNINTALGRMRYALLNLRKMAENNHLSA